jgi:hypothetical protein
LDSRIDKAGTFSMRHLASSVLALLLLAVALQFSARALAHGGDAILPVRLAVTEWASALQGRDKAAMSAMLSADFPQKERYLAALPLTPIMRVDLHHATLNIHDDTASFTPVVTFPRVNMENPEAFALTLKHENDGWKISAMAPTGAWHHRQYLELADRVIGAYLREGGR